MLLTVHWGTVLEKATGQNLSDILAYISRYSRGVLRNALYKSTIIIIIIIYKYTLRKDTF